MELFVAGTGMAARCNPAGRMGSDCMALFPHPQFQPESKAVIGNESSQGNKETQIDHGRHELDV